MSNISFSRSFMKCGWIKFEYTVVFIGKWNYALPSRQMHHLPKVEVMLSYLSNKSQNQDYRSCFHQEKHSSWTLEWYFETKLVNKTLFTTWIMSAIRDMSWRKLFTSWQKLKNLTRLPRKTIVMMRWNQDQNAQGKIFSKTWTFIIVLKIFIDYKLEHVYNDHFCKAEWSILQTSCYWNRKTSQILTCLSHGIPVVYVLDTTIVSHCLRATFLY